MSKCGYCGKKLRTQEEIYLEICNECKEKISEFLKKPFKDCYYSNEINYMHIIDFEDYLNAKTQTNKDEIAKGFYDCLTKTTQINCDFIKENLKLKSELEELKKKSVVNKFKVGDIVYVIRKIKQDIVKARIISDKHISRKCCLNKFILLESINKNTIYRFENELFATYEEAEEALKKIGG